MPKREVLPVPPEMVSHYWWMVGYELRKIPGYDVERTHSRLLLGIDTLWVSDGWHPWTYCNYALIITSISPRPFSTWKRFQRQDRKQMKSLSVHVLAGTQLLSWLASARERICAYARQHGCRQLFLATRKGWQRHFTSWWSTEWEAVAMSRDRPTKSTCHKLSFRNTPGYYRLMVPVPREKFNRCLYTLHSTYYFPAESAATCMQPWGMCAGKAVAA